MERVRQDGDLETGISPNFLIRNWPLAFRLQEQMRDQEQKETAYSDPNLLTIMKTIKLQPWPQFTRGGETSVIFPPSRERSFYAI